MFTKYLKLTPLVLCMAAIPAMAQTDAERLDMLEQQVSSLQQELNSAAGDRVRLNGFFSTGFATASNDAGFAGIIDESEIEDLSLFALQGTFLVNQDTQAIMQLVSRGAEQWDAEVEWAFLSHQLTNNLQVRAGKMRLPFYMYSDSLEVGYSQLWARPPVAVYGGVPFTSYVGADATYTHNLNGSSISTQVFGGYSENDDDRTGIDAELRNGLGINVAWTDYTWTLRAIAHGGKANITLNRPGMSIEVADRARTRFYGVGASYDDGTWLVISELTRAEVDGTVPDPDAAYITLGRRISNFTPYVSVAWKETQDNDERVLPGQQVSSMKHKEYSLGMRWDVLSGVAVKLDWTHARGFAEKPGGLSNAEFVLNNGINSTNVYTFTIDSAF